MKEDRGIHSFFRGCITMDVQVRGSTQNDEALAGSVCVCVNYISRLRGEIRKSVIYS